MRRRADEESPHPFLSRSQRKTWTLFSLIHLLIQVFKMMMRKSRGIQQQERQHWTTLSSVTTRLASYQQNGHSTRERQENSVHIGREKREVKVNRDKIGRSRVLLHLPFLGLRFTNLNNLLLHFYILSYSIIVRGCRCKNWTNGEIPVLRAYRVCHGFMSRDPSRCVPPV